jgi:hypothetical protein
MIQADTSPLQDLATRKCEQLPSQASRMLRLIADPREFLTDWATAGGFVVAQLCPPKNNPESVVEIVSNATGKPANGLEFL